MTSDRSKVYLMFIGPCIFACNTDTTATQPHRNCNTHRTKNKTTDVVIQQNSRKLLIMDILMSETCWAHKKWNKIASDIKLVFYSSTRSKVYSLLWYGRLLVFLYIFYSLYNYFDSNRKVAVSIPAGSLDFSIDIKSFRSHFGLGVDSASNRNEYQEHFLGVKAAGT